MRILILDGMNIFIRSFVVVPSMDSDGNPTGGITGFLKSLKNLVNDSRAERVIVAWDGEGGSVRRRKIFKDYKEGRKVRLNRTDEDATPGEQVRNMEDQLRKLKVLLDLLGVVQVEASGTEADDAIAFMCRFVFPEDQKVVVTSDRDMLQLVENRTIVYSPSKKTYWTRHEIKEKIGVLAENYIFVKAMMGDSSDNIPGVGGIGEKTAVKLFPFLAERLTNPAEIREHAETNRDSNSRYKAVLDRWDRFMENVKLMQLSSPSISAQAANTIKTSSTQQKPKFVFTEFKLQLIRDGIQVLDPDLLNVFQSYKIRVERRA